MKTEAARRRAEAAQRRADTRAWVVDRRLRTRHLIELGGLVLKSGLVALADDDRATLYGALLDLAARATGDDAGTHLALWTRRGHRAFDAEANALPPRVAMGASAAPPAPSAEASAGPPRRPARG